MSFVPLSSKGWRIIRPACYFYAPAEVESFCSEYLRRFAQRPIPPTMQECAHFSKPWIKALELSGFCDEAEVIFARWKQAVSLAGAFAPPDYAFCYPGDLIGMTVEKARQGVAEMQCRLAAPDTEDDVRKLLNGAWTQFWKDPVNYQQWETAAVARLRSSLIK